MPWSRLDEVFVETAEHGNLNWLKCLLKSGANVNATSWDGYSALIKASKEGNVDLIEFEGKYVRSDIGFDLAKYEL